MPKTVCKLSDIPDKGAKVVEVDETPISLFRVDKEVYALHNICPHQGGPLNEGFIDGTKVTCPWHAWEFDIKTGECLTVPQSRQRCFKVHVKGEDVLVDI